ncbi:hypothetical protein [Photobacterium damselae]|uniref:hypothetical protein n=1 Tax=Photobacterium damselae TaxID=38293 RepID=UPI001F3457A7|nr:hypothetical protein [Photobacterium damselae]UKA04462.1 hypothetical protein IHC89_22835 [Photobacterium damselae subsp. damselae]
MKKICNVIEGDVKTFLSKLVAAKLAAITEVENSDLYDTSIDVDYVGIYIGAPVRRYVRDKFFEAPVKSHFMGDVKRAAALTVIKELLCSRRDTFGFICLDSSFEKELSKVGCVDAINLETELLRSPEVELITKSATPIELMGWFCSKGDLSFIMETFARLSEVKESRFVDVAEKSLLKAQDAVSSVCIKHSVFFEMMLQVFTFCKCAQLMKEDSFSISNVYSKSLKLLEEYSKSVMECGYVQLSLAYTLSVIFNTTQSKCAVLKEIMRRYAILDHFMFGGVLNCNDSDDKLSSKIQNSFFEVLSEEDVSFLKLSADDRLRISNLTARR